MGKSLGNCPEFYRNNNNLISGMSKGTFSKGRWRTFFSLKQWFSGLALYNPYKNLFFKFRGFSFNLAGKIAKILIVALFHILADVFSIEQNYFHYPLFLCELNFNTLLKHRTSRLIIWGTVKVKNLNTFLSLVCMELKLPLNKENQTQCHGLKQSIFLPVNKIKAHILLISVFLSF